MWIGHVGLLEIKRLTVPLGRIESFKLILSYSLIPRSDIKPNLLFWTHALYSFLALVHGIYIKIRETIFFSVIEMINPTSPGRGRRGGGVVQKVLKTGKNKWYLFFIVFFSNVKHPKIFIIYVFLLSKNWEKVLSTVNVYFEYSFGYIQSGMSDSQQFILFTFAEK